MIGLDSSTPIGTLQGQSAKSSDRIKKYIVTLIGERADLVNRLAASHMQVLKLHSSLEELEGLSDVLMSFLSELIFLAQNENNKISLN